MYREIILQGRADVLKNHIPCKSTIIHVENLWFTFCRINNNGLHWLEQLGIEKENYQSKPRDALCSKHFNLKDVSANKSGRVVKSTAIPAFGRVSGIILSITQSEFKYHRLHLWNNTWHWYIQNDIQTTSFRAQVVLVRGLSRPTLSYSVILCRWNLFTLVYNPPNNPNCYKHTLDHTCIKMVITYAEKFIGLVSSICGFLCIFKTTSIHRVSLKL